MSLFIGLFLAPLVWSQTELVSLYEHFHANPELSYQERDTAERLAAEFEHSGLRVTRGFGTQIRETLKEDGAIVGERVGSYGVVAVLENGAGPTLMLRADMDALPVPEQTGLSYASRARGQELTGEDVPVMHACGHDTHMTVVVGTVRELVRRQQEWSGTLVVIGQQAEERGSGARMLLEAGLFERFPRPDYNLALHGSATLPAGDVETVSGWMMANVDSVDITVHGVGGHGAYPHMGKDPVVLASAIVMDLQTLVSREIDPQSPAVVTVGSIHGGSKHNIIPDSVSLQLTVRSYSDGVRSTLLQGIERVALNQARALGFPEDKLPKVQIKSEATPALWNDPGLTARAVSVLRNELGEAHVKTGLPVMGGEDFARYGRVEPSIPSLLFRLGSVPRERYRKAQESGTSLPSMHSPLYYPEPALTIQTGVRSMTAVAIDLLQ